MKAMIFSAGYGTRMKPLSDVCPKPCLPFYGRPLIAHQLDWLCRHGVTSAILNLHHMGSAVRTAAEKNCPDGMTLAFLDEPTIRGTGGGLVNASTLLYDSSEFLAINGDIFTNIDLTLPIRAHRQIQAMATLVLTTNPQHSDLFGVGIDADNHVTDFWGDPPSDQFIRRGAFTGIHVLNPEFLNTLPNSGFACVKEHGYLPALQENIVIHAFVTGGDWFDLGTPERYLDAHFGMLSQSADLSGYPVRYPGVVSADPLPQSLRITPPVVVGPNLTIVDPNASIGPGAILGANVTLGPKTHVEQSVIWDGVCLKGTVRQSIVAPGGQAVHVNADPPEVDTH
jgi:NDP-sugar pyrophosphorylase family protein